MSCYNCNAEISENDDRCPKCGEITTIGVTNKEALANDSNHDRIEYEETWGPLTLSQAGDRILDSMTGKNMLSQAEYDKKMAELDLVDYPDEPE